MPSTAAPSPSLTVHLQRWLRFGWRVIKQFWKNNGVVLAGGVALNTLLSIIPLAMVLTALLSHLFTEQTAMYVIEQELAILVPGDPSQIQKELRSFEQYRKVFGWSGALILLFQSSLAFRTMKDAMSAIFRRSARPQPFWKALLIPFVYVLFFVLLIAALTVLGLLIDTYVRSDLAGYGFYFLAVMGHVALFTAYYLTMPTTPVGFKRALIGGAVAAILWEGVRTSLTWYFAQVSVVGVVYGSLATAIVVLLGMEIIAIILLLGAQVIAELIDSETHGIAWHEEAPEGPQSA